MSQPTPSPVLSTHDCQQCGQRWTRQAHKGQQPKWCSVTCRELGKKGAHRVCERCATPYFGIGKRFCSKDCAGISRQGASTGFSAPIRLAYEAEDWDSVLELMRNASRLEESSGCWLWLGSITRDGYPSITRKKGFLGAHRVSLEAKSRAFLGSQSAHHTCANSGCVNPEHLVPVTHAQNVAEMLARRSYRKRISELEQALAELNPGHPLLALIPHG